jgi:hypothetical protein
MFLVWAYLASRFSEGETMSMNHDDNGVITSKVNETVEDREPSVQFFSFTERSEQGIQFFSCP